MPNSNVGLPTPADIVRRKHEANREQREFQAEEQRRGMETMRKNALEAGVNPSRLPNPPTKSATMSQADREKYNRTYAGLPGYPQNFTPALKAASDAAAAASGLPRISSMAGLPGKQIPAGLSGPRTAQNTGVTGVKMSTPDFGATRNIAGRGAETWMPDDSIAPGGGRWVGSVASPPPRTDIPQRPPAPAPIDTTPAPTTFDPKTGVRSIEGQYGTGSATDGNSWRYALRAAHPEIFQPGTAANAEFVAAHQGPDGKAIPVDPAKAMGIANDLALKRQIAAQQKNAPTPLAPDAGKLDNPGLSLSSGVATEPSLPVIGGTATWPKMQEATPAEAKGIATGRALKSAGNTVGSALTWYPKQVASALGKGVDEVKQFAQGMMNSPASPIPSASPGPSSTDGLPMSAPSSPPPSLPEPKFATSEQMGLPGPPLDDPLKKRKLMGLP